MAAFLDVCRFTPTLGGTTDWTYSVAVTGYQGPTAAGAANGTVYRYRAESADLSQWEVGSGAYNSGTGALARTTVLFNSSGTTSKINFTAAPQVAIVALAEDLPGLGLPNIFTDTTEATGAGTTASGIFKGGFEILKKLFVAGVASFTNTVASTDRSTGAVVVGNGTSGGLAVGGQVSANNVATFNTPGAVPCFDSSGSAVVGDASALTSSYAVGPAGANTGMIIAYEYLINGGIGMFLVASNNVVTAYKNTGLWVDTTKTPPSGFCSVAYDSGTNSIKLYNNYNTSARFRVQFIRA